MARPVNADPAATRRRVLESACALFAERGLTGASVRDIARGAHVSLATVMHHFGNKEGLYQACIDAMYAELAQLRAHLQGTVAECSSAAELVQQAVRQGFRFARRHRRAIRLLMREVISGGGLDAARRDAHMLPFLRDGSRVLAALTGRPAPHLRLLILSLQHLVVRYALAEADELVPVVGVGEAVQGPDGSTEPDEATLHALEEHLCTIALDQMGLRRATTTRATAK